MAIDKPPALFNIPTVDEMRVTRDPVFSGEERRVYGEQTSQPRATSMQLTLIRTGSPLGEIFKLAQGKTSIFAPAGTPAHAIVVSIRARARHHRGHFYNGCGLAALCRDSLPPSAGRSRIGSLRRFMAATRSNFPGQ